MRRIQPKLTGLLLFACLSALLIGCSKGSGDTASNANAPAGQGKPLNPSGKVTDPTQKSIGSGLQQAGQNSESMAAKAAAGFKGH